MAVNPGRREEYAAATRAAVLAAARTCFAASGAATSAEQIAAVARVAKGSVFHHFGDKRQLYEAVFDAEERALVERVLAAVPATDDPRRLLAAGAGAFLEACRDPDVRALVIVHAPEVLGWARWKAAEERWFLGQVTALVTRAVGPAQAPLLARMVVAALDEAALVVDGDADVAAAVDAVLRLLDVPTDPHDG